MTISRKRPLLCTGRVATYERVECAPIHNKTSTTHNRGYVMLFKYIFKKLKGAFHQLNSKNNGLVLLLDATI